MSWSDSEYWEDSNFEDNEDECDYVEDMSEPADIQCNRCGATGLTWGDQEGPWRLFERDGSRHQCSFLPKRKYKMDPKEAQ